MTLEISVSFNSEQERDAWKSWLNGYCEVCKKKLTDEELKKGWTLDLCGIGTCGVGIAIDHKWCKVKRFPISYAWFWLTLLAYIPLKIIGKWD